MQPTNIIAVPTKESFALINKTETPIIIAKQTKNKRNHKKKHKNCHKVAKIPLFQKEKPST